MKVCGAAFVLAGSTQTSWLKSTRVGGMSQHTASRFQHASPSRHGKKAEIRLVSDEVTSSPVKPGKETEPDLTSSTISGAGETEVSEGSKFPGYPQVELDPEELKEKAMRAVEDVSLRPGYYGKIVVYILGGLVSFTVLKAIVAAVDSLPVLPGFLELVGLAYCAWFGWRYVIFKSSREELMEEVDVLLGRATGQRSDE